MEEQIEESIKLLDAQIESLDSLRKKLDIFLAKIAAVSSKYSAILTQKTDLASNNFIVENYGVEISDLNHLNYTFSSEGKKVRVFRLTIFQVVIREGLFGPHLKRIKKITSFCFFKNGKGDYETFQADSHSLVESYFDPNQVPILQDYLKTLSNLDYLNYFLEENAE